MARFKKAKDIKVGVIGYGGAFNMGKKHLQEMQAAGMTPVAVAELDPSRLEVAKDDFPGIETYTSVATMLKKSDVNLITIITPHNTHAKLALQCLNAGKSVVCEKPLAITTKECDAMIAAAKKKKVVLSTYHNRHWDGCILGALKEVKQKKSIGDIIRISCRWGGYGQPGNWWRTSKTISGGVMYDWGVHLLEYSLQLIDSDITEVTGFNHHGYWAPKTSWKKDCNEDEGYAIVRFKSGQMLSLNVTTIDSNINGGQVEVTGTKGSYIMGIGNWEMIQHRAGGKRVITKGPSPQGTQHFYYQNVADHMVKGTKLVISGEWSRRPIHILDLADQSAKKNTTLKAKHK